MSYYKYISTEDLNVEQLTQLVTTIRRRRDITQFEITEIFEDDHSECCNILINGVEIPIYYYDNINFVHNWRTSKAAFRNLRAAIHNVLEMAADSQSVECCVKNVGGLYKVTIIE